MFQIRSFCFAIVTIFSTHLLNAHNYDMDLLNTYSKLSPRFVLMSTQKSKIDNAISICLAYDEKDEKVAQNFIEFSRLNYPEGIKEYRIEFVKSQYVEISKCNQTQLIFLFDTNEESLKKVIEFSKQKQIMTISYSHKLLELGVDISLFIARDTYPYLNLQSIFEKSIRLDNILLRVSKIYKKPLEEIQE